MEAYGKVLLIAMPIFLVLIFLEAGIATMRGKQWDVIDSVASLASGMTNILKDTLELSLVIVSYPILLQYLKVFDLTFLGAGVYALTFLLMDFCGYWRHRMEHEKNYLWNLHIIHHSSEQFNLPCALRQSIARITNVVFIFFYGILFSVLGIPHEVFMVVAPLHLFIQFWYHTELIDKMSFLEYFLVTPSHHRVHHAMNDVYMDKNYSEVFIVWDKLFGTFQTELADVPPVYGVRRAVQTWNPFLINFQHLAILVSDAWQTKNTWDKIRIWWQPTGWRPADVEAAQPIEYIKDVNNFERYAPVYSAAFKAWAVVQLILSFILLSFLFFSFGKITYNEAVIYGLFMLLSVFAFTALLDKKGYGLVADSIKTAVGFGLIYTQNDWFGLSQYWSAGVYCVATYFIVTLCVNTYFYKNNF
jgi:alkylglycerol monooxygenase